MTLVLDFASCSLKFLTPPHRLFISSSHNIPIHFHLLHQNVSCNASLKIQLTTYQTYVYLVMATKRVTRNRTGPEPLETVSESEPFTKGSEPRNRETAGKKVVGAVKPPKKTA